MRDGSEPYPVYQTPGTFTSSIIDTTVNIAYGTITWNATTPENTALTIKVRSCDDDACSGETAFDSISETATSGNDISSLADVTDGDQYIQYQATLTTSDDAVTPELEDITINYTYYTSSSTLTSSSFNTESATNVVGGLSWNETVSEGVTDVKFQISTSADNISWTDFLGPTDTSDYYSTSPVVVGSINSAHKNGDSDQYVKYKVFLTSDGTASPTLSDLTLTYVVNAPPNFNDDYPSASAGGVSATSDFDNLVSIGYSVRDIDTSTGACENCVTPSFEYSIDNGDNWSDDITLGLSSGATDSKTVGQSAYNIYTPTWDATDVGALSDTYTATAKIQVTVNDGEGANATASASSTAFTIDTKSPVSPSISIDSGDTYATSTTVTLTISASDDTMTGLQMMISNDDSNFASSSWEDYLTSKSWTLTDTDGTRTVYIKFKDAYGNESASANDTIILDTTPPAVPVNMNVMDISNYVTEEYRLFISWGVVADPADWQRYNVWRSTDGTSYGESAYMTITNRATNYFSETGLSTSTTYYYKVTTEDTNGNISSFSSVVSDSPDGQGGTDVAPPTISSVASSNIYPTQATITWNTDELSNSTVGYSTTIATFTTEVGVATMLDTASSVGVHSVTLTGLTPNTTYYYQAKSDDASGNTGTDNNGGNGYTFTTLQGPNISNVTTESIDNESATVKWITDISSNSYVVYSTNADLSSLTEAGSAASATAHSVEISSLTQGTKYYYYVKSTDGSSNLATDNNGGEYYTFTTTQDTTAPTITFDSSANITNITNSSATISWTTNELATSIVDYGTTISYGNNETNTNLNTDHSFTISDLAPETIYYFKISSTDDNDNTATDDNSSAGYTFTTLSLFDTTAPTISSVSVGTPNPTSVVVTWTTSESSSSLVDFGTTTDYGTTQGNSIDAVTSHSVTLTGLTPSTDYYARVKSIDSAGNIATDDNSGSGHSFTTADSPDPGDTSAPLISNISTDPTVTANTATITWTTDENSDSVVGYSQDQSFATEKGETTQTTSHSITLSGLAPATIYYFQVKSTDASGNLSTNSNSNAGYPFTTSAGGDSVSPVISSVETSNIAINQLQSHGLLMKHLLLLLTLEQFRQHTQTPKGATSHSVNLVNLASGMDYYFRVRSIDSAGNQALDDNNASGYTLTTDQDDTPPNIQPNSKPDSRHHRSYQLDNQRRSNKPS